MQKTCSSNPPVVTWICDPNKSRRRHNGISTCSCKNGKYLASIMDDSVITCDVIIESYDKEINFDEKKATSKT